MKKLTESTIKGINLQIDNADDVFDAMKQEVRKSWEGQSVSVEYIKEKADRIRGYLDAIENELK